MSKVYIVNDSGLDFTHAEKFGELIIMTKDLVKRFDITSMIRIFNTAFKDASKEDYILQSGPTVMNMIACALFAHKFGRLNILLWKADNSGGEEYYISRKIVFKKGKANVV